MYEGLASRTQFPHYVLLEANGEAIVEERMRSLKRRSFEVAHSTLRRALDGRWYGAALLRRRATSPADAGHAEPASRFQDRVPTRCTEGRVPTRSRRVQDGRVHTAHS